MSSSSNHWWWIRRQVCFENEEFNLPILMFVCIQINICIVRLTIIISSLLLLKIVLWYYILLIVVVVEHWLQLFSTFTYRIFCSNLLSLNAFVECYYKYIFDIYGNYKCNFFCCKDILFLWRMCLFEFLEVNPQSVPVLLLESILIFTQL